MKRACFILLLALTACQGKVTKEGVLVDVINKSDAEIVQLQVTVTNSDRKEDLRLPATPQSTPIKFPTSFSISVPSGRAGQVEIAIIGFDLHKVPVAHAKESTNLQANTFVPLTVNLQPGAPSASGGAGGSGGTSGTAESGGNTGSGGTGPGETTATGRSSGGALSSGQSTGSSGNTRTGGTNGGAGVAGTGGTTDQVGGATGVAGYSGGGGLTGSGGIAIGVSTSGSGGDSGMGGNTVRGDAAVAGDTPTSAPTVVATTLAGNEGAYGSMDGTGAEASFRAPWGVAVSANPEAYVFVADRANSNIRKITSSGVVSTFAGTANSIGSVDGAGATALFNLPRGIAVDVLTGKGYVFVADTGNSTIRMINPSGVVSTLAGTALSTGSVDGTGASARFSNPQRVAVDNEINVFVADTGNSTIRKITLAGVVTTLAGAAKQTGSTDGTGSDARFTGPEGIAVDSVGNVFVADAGNSTIRKITRAGMVTTFAGTPGSRGRVDGTGAAARFSSLMDIAMDRAGNIFALDGDLIRKITPTGVVTTLVVRGISSVRGVGVDPAGNLFVVGEKPAWIQKITISGL